MILQNSISRTKTHDPSFFPIGSSYSIPTQTPSPVPNLVKPTNRTVPRLWKSASVLSTSHREPIGIFSCGGAFDDSFSLSFSANLPILCLCLYARTVSATRHEDRDNIYVNQSEDTDPVFENTPLPSAQTCPLETCR